MNSGLIVQEEIEGTSSVQPAAFPMWRPFLGSGLGLREASTATTINTGDGLDWYVTLTVSGASGFRGLEQAKKTKVEYEDAERVEALLGSEGRRVLDKVIDLITRASRNREWPLSSIEVGYVEDAEVEDWRYALVVPVYECPFDQADNYLHDLYGDVDHLACSLNAEGQAILQKKLFFDVRATV